MPRFRDPQTVKMPGSKGKIIYYESGKGWLREVLAGKRTRLPDVPILGRASYKRAVDHLPEHLHQQSFEICRIESGKLDWKINAQNYSLAPGDIFFTLPGVVHGGENSMLQPCRLFWVQVFEKIDGSDSTYLTTQKLLRTLSRLGLRKFPGDATCRECFIALFEEEKKADDLSSLALRLALNQLLVAVIRAGRKAVSTSSGGKGRPVSRAIKTALDHVRTHWREHPDIERLAESAGLRRSQFLQRFVEEIGQTPSSIRQGILLEKAKDLLRNTRKSITTIALDLNISSSQYFATWFNQHTGLSPIKYRSSAAPDRRVALAKK
jgi:AraC-like DNA-binding protein/mannose-6-phosphate isomerase-like protein (cupin superfamily)